MDVNTRFGYQLRGVSPATSADVSSEIVAWSTADGSAYALVSHGGSPSVFQLSREEATVRVFGRHVAWTALDDDGASMTFGRVRW